MSGALVKAKREEVACFGCGKVYYDPTFGTMWHGEIAASREVALCTGR